MSSVGKSIPHDSAVGHVTGAAPYIDDYVPLVDELYVDFAGSPVAAGSIAKVDVSAAESMPGVVLILTAADVAGHNIFGAIVADEPFLANDQVHYVGQPVVAIAAESAEIARAARSAVVIEVVPSDPVFTIDEAISRKKFLAPPRRIARGDFKTAWNAAPRRIEGVFRCGGQEQFYLESQASIAYPDEQGRIVVHCSTQNPTETQIVLAEVLGIGQHEVVCICKRMGGGFGGKETQSAIPATIAALVAQRTGRAARMVLDKDDDMRITGKRHPYRAEYQVGFDNDGRLLAVRFQFHSDGGAFLDLSTGVLERTMLHCDNAYYIPDIEIEAQVCRTNFPPNTAFRGFGGPQGMAAMENVMQEIAITLGKDALDVRQANLYGTTDRNVTPYGQHVGHHLLNEVTAKLKKSSDYDARIKEVVESNAKSPLELRGLAMTPMKFGISFTTRFLNQGNALVNVYTDGTIQVSTGATEMGQGVNTKIQQLVADEFGIAIDNVRVMQTSTEKNNNTSPTAASASTDLNGAAAVNACREIRVRMAEFAAHHFACPEDGVAASIAHIRFRSGAVYDSRRPDHQVDFGEFTAMARRARVDMGARGFYATPGVDFNRETGKGTPFFYFTTGAAVSEVAIDRFTGDVRVERVDLLMDIGRTINPGIDRGQVIGGFVQGMGYVTAEELKYDEAGRLLSHSPTTYKIPAVTDVPPIFNVDFIENFENARNVRSSKAVGEPPLMLALSVWAAIKHALSCTLEGAVPNLKIPATNEEVLMCLERMRTDT